MRVLLTGGGGAIGVHVIAHIMHNTDWTIVATDSFAEQHKGYYDRIIRVCRDHSTWESRIRIVQHDLCAPFTQREIDAIGKIDYIINLASRSDVQFSIDDPISFVKNNVDLMLTMLEYARIAKPKAFIQFSTDEVYGPAPVESNGHKEWSPILPSNPYSASKACQEAISIAWWRCFNIPLILTNTMNNFGEMQAASKFPAMIQKNIETDTEINVHATANGQLGTRYYIHSRNVADALLFILQKIPVILHTAGKIDKPLRFNIVGDKQVSNLELVNLIGRLMKKTPKYKLSYFHDANPGHDLHYGLDGSELAKLGWESPLSFEESLKNTIDWQQRNPEWLK